MADPVPEIRNTAFPQRRPAARTAEDFSRWFETESENEDSAPADVPFAHVRTSLEDLILLQEFSARLQAERKIVNAYERQHAYEDVALHVAETEEDGQYVFAFLNDIPESGSVLNRKI